MAGYDDKKQGDDVCPKLSVTSTFSAAVVLRSTEHHVRTSRQRADCSSRREGDYFFGPAAFSFDTRGSVLTFTVIIRTS